MTRARQAWKTLSARLEGVRSADLAWGGGALGLGLALSIGGLAFVATPGHRAERLGAIRTELAQAADLAERDRGYADEPPGMICRARPEAVATALTSAINGLSAKWGLHGVITVERQGQAVADPGLRRQTFQLRGEGGSRQIFGFMADLQSIRPALIADRVDLKSKVSALSLNIEGSLLCWR
jgi:hypothetical protein